MVLLVLCPITFVAIGVLFENGFSINVIVQYVAYMLFFVFLFILMNMFYPYSDSMYMLDENSIFVSKGNKSNKYVWSEFKCFYNYSMHKFGKLKKYNKNIENVAGTIFYLEIKDCIIGRSFLVLRTDPENSKDVYTLLKRQLFEEKYTTKDDFGFKKYLYN